MMKIGRTFLHYIGILVVLPGMVACQSVPERNETPPVLARPVQAVAGFEAAGPVDARQFIGTDLMQSPLYRVDPKAWNDGYVNTYRIETPDHVHIVQGTDQAIMRLREIVATDRLRRKSATITVGKAAVDRTLNLATTPVRAVKMTANRFSTAKGAQEKLMVVPSGAANIVGNLALGLKELGMTGWRITTNAAGKKCKGVGECTAQAGGGVMSGVSALSGKDAAARKIHAELGTDPYSDNEELQRQVNRLATADAVGSTSMKLGMAFVSAPLITPLSTGVGYYNNGEFIVNHEDPRKARAVEQSLMRQWGVSKEDIEKLYDSDAFTHTTRSKLFNAVSTFGENTYKARMIREAAHSSSRFLADSRVKVYQYLAQMVMNGQVKAFVADLPSAIALGTDGTLILPFAADYLRWTPELAPTITNLAALTGPGTPYPRASVHILGQASPLFTARATGFGVRVVEIRNRL